MGEFNEMCKSLIQNSDMSIYKIAKNSGLERTALNRMVNGKRLLNQQDFEKFCDAVRLGKRDRDKLYELYLMEKVGKNKYENRKYILDMLEYMDSLNNGISMADFRDTLEEKAGWESGEGDTYPDNDVSRHFWQISLEEMTRDSCVSGGMEVKALLRNILHEAFQGEAIIYTNIPACCTDFFENIEYLYRIYRKKLTVYHYFMLHSSPANYYNSNYNLEVLKNILPWIFSMRQEYHPYYTYSNSMLEDMTNTVMSYFLVTDAHVIQLTSEMDSAIIHSEPQVIRLYREKIIWECQNNMHHLLAGTCCLTDKKEQYIEYVSHMGKLTHCLEPSPCPAMILLRPTTDAAGKVRVPVCFRSLSSQQEMSVLSFLAEEVKAGGMYVRMAGKEMPVLQNISLELYKQGIIIRLFGRGELFWTMSIAESSICESFRDFLDSMEEMKLVEDREMTLKILVGH